MRGISWKKLILLIAAPLFVAVLVGVLIGLPHGSGSRAVESEDGAKAVRPASSYLKETPEGRVRATRPASDVTRKSVAEQEQETEAIDAWVEDLPVADRPLGQRLVDAIDKDDLSALKRLLPEVRACANKDVRLRTVEGLDWFGKDAVVELTSFLVDKDKEVAESAFNAWDSAVDQVEDEAFRISVASDVMKTITDPDNLSGAATKLEGADDRKAAILALAAVAESGNKAAAAAVREAYEFIVGEEWTDAAAARAKAQTIELEE